MLHYSLNAKITVHHCAIWSKFSLSARKEMNFIVYKKSGANYCKSEFLC